MMSESLKEFVKMWKEFCGYVVETMPNYVDSDFSLENFMSYLEMISYPENTEL